LVDRGDAIRVDGYEADLAMLAKAKVCSQLCNRCRLAYTRRADERNNRRLPDSHQANRTGGRQHRLDCVGEMRANGFGIAKLIVA